MKTTKALFCNTTCLFSAVEEADDTQLPRVSEEEMSRERRCSPEAWLSSFCCPTKWKVCRLLSPFFASAVFNFAVTWSLVFSTPSTMFFAAPFSWNRFYKIIFIWATIVTLQFSDKNGNHLCPVLLILSDTHTISINIKVKWRYDHKHQRGWSVAPVSRGHGFKPPLKSWLFQASIRNCMLKLRS